MDALDALLNELGTEISIVPYIRVSPEVLLARLAGRWTCRKCGHGYHALFDPPEVEGVCDFVITSYSIHYTKLYEWMKTRMN